MKIVHICIINPYVDNWGYQENLLPEYLNKFGWENHIITSNDNHPEYLDEKLKKEIVAKGDKYQLGNVMVHKIRCKRLTSSVFLTYGLWKKLEEIKPDVIFHHNISITTLPIVSKFAKKYNCKLFVDNHADEINMSKNKLWVLFYYKGLSRLACRIRKKTYTKFFGVTHSRCEFINKYCGVPKDMIELLPIGADTDLADTLESKEKLRIKYNIPMTDYVIVSGGKMGSRKGTINLINAVEECGVQNVKLLLFGKFEDEETEKLANCTDSVIVCGWCDRLKTLELLKLADIACWPIHHTTLNEDAIAVETPLILRRTGTTKHLIDENGVWLNNGDKDELIKIIRHANSKLINGDMFACGCKKMKSSLSYNNIAETVVLRAKQ